MTLISKLEVAIVWPVGDAYVLKEYLRCQAKVSIVFLSQFSRGMRANHAENNLLSIFIVFNINSLFSFNIYLQN